jgi:hypothetical protein
MKKIFYVPGLISACIIPILFWFYGNRKLNEPVPNVMDIGLPARIDSTNEWSYKYSFENFRDWNFKNILVKPNTARANSEYYVSEIKKLQERNQKETGIEFIITNENSYDDFISILNDCHISKQERYGVDMDKTGHFFVLVDYKDPNAKDNLLGDDFVLCGTSYIYQDYNSYSENFLEKFIKQLSQLSNPSYYLIFGFLILLNISMLSIKESLQNH